jgi:hypothetical protein
VVIASWPAPSVAQGYQSTTAIIACVLANFAGTSKSQVACWLMERLQSAVAPETRGGTVNVIEVEEKNRNSLLRMTVSYRRCLIPRQGGPFNAVTDFS